MKRLWISTKIILATYLLEWTSRLIPKEEAALRLRTVRLWRDIAKIGLSPEDIAKAYDHPALKGKYHA